MPFQFTCPYCFKKTWVDEQLAGRKGPCAACGKLVTIPDVGNHSDRSPTVQPAGGGTWTLKRIFAGRKWVVLAVAIPLLILAGWISWQAVQSVGSLSIIQNFRQRTNRVSCMNHVSRIARALDAYAATHGRYPPAIVYDSDGKPLHSWRVLILRELGEFDLHNNYRFDEPWDSEHNSTFLGSQCPRVFISPQRSDFRYSSDTNYFLIVGEGTVFPHDAPPLSPDEIGDGREQTLLIVEANNSMHEWTKPIDIDIATWQAGSGPLSVGGNHSGGFTAAFADGTPAWIPADTPPELIRDMMTPNGSQSVDRSRFIQQ
jgi:hypothetical protein